ncbi:aspartic peptidase domain-containing protein [Tricladium varicosporioides]|nr:aspartic peptidase domain-containing protein [Hymenoscyphus varicosporioides]
MRASILISLWIPILSYSTTVFASRTLDPSHVATIPKRSPPTNDEGIISTSLFQDGKFWFANFSIGNVSNLALLVDTGSSDILLNREKYLPSGSSKDLNKEVNISFSTSNSDGTGSESMTVHALSDAISLPGTNLIIPSQAFGEVTTPISPPQFPHDGLIGLSSQENSLLNFDPWFTSLCATHQIPACRFGLALGVNKTGMIYLGGVEEGVIKGEGELSKAPLQSEWVTWGDVVFGGEVIERGARMLMDSGTAVIFGPFDVVQNLFNLAGIQSISRVTLLREGVNATILTGYYPCATPPIFGFGFPSLANISLAESNMSSPVSNSSRIFNVAAEALVQNSTNGICTSSIYGAKDLDLWLVGQPFFQGRYIDHNFDNGSMGFADLG